MNVRIRSQVVEVSTSDDRLSRRPRPARDLLPWADPYIAGLMRRLEGRHGADDADSCDPFAADDGAGGSVIDDGWQEDAFMPRPLEVPRFHSFPPVVGGFPLLDDE